MKPIRIYYRDNRWPKKLLSTKPQAFSGTRVVTVALTPAVLCAALLFAALPILFASSRPAEPQFMYLEEGMLDEGDGLIQEIGWLRGGSRGRSSGRVVCVRPSVSSSSNACHDCVKKAEVTRLDRRIDELAERVGDGPTPSTVGAGLFQ